MKNITNSTLAYLLALCAVMLLLEAGCTTTIAPTKGGGTGLSLLEGLAPGDILSRYDTSNLVGIIDARTEAYHVVTHVFPASGRSNWTGTNSWGQAQFMDATGNSLDIGAVDFNRQFPNIQTSTGPSGSYAYAGNDLPIYTDGTTENYVMVMPFDTANGRAFDSLTYSVVPTITNITFNQNLSRDSNITVNWTGTSSDFVQLSVITWDSTGTNDTTGHGISVGGYYNNTGSATISLHKDQLELGLADVELRVYTPKFITLSNGKRVAVVVETCEEITVHIVD